MRVLSNLVSVEMDKATFEHHVEFLRRVVNNPQISNNIVKCIMKLVDWEEFAKISIEQEDVWIHRMNLTPHVVPASGKLPPGINAHLVVIVVVCETVDIIAGTCLVMQQNVVMVRKCIS